MVAGLHPARGLGFGELSRRLPAMIKSVSIALLVSVLLFACEKQESPAPTADTNVDFNERTPEISQDYFALRPEVAPRGLD